MNKVTDKKAKVSASQAKGTAEIILDGMPDVALIDEVSAFFIFLLHLFSACDRI